MFNTNVSNTNFNIGNVPKSAARDGVNGCPHYFGNEQTLNIKRFNGYAEKTVRLSCPVCGTTRTKVIKYNDNKISYGGY